MQKKIFCSTGTFLGRRNGCDPALVESIAPQLGCDGLELMVFPTWDNDDVMRRMAATGLSFPTLHASKSVGDLLSSGDDAEALRLFDFNCRAARIVGAKTVVVHLWGPPVSDGNFEHNLRLCGELVKRCDAAGLVCAVENIPCVHGDPLTRFYALAAAYETVKFTFDTRMAAFAGQVESSFAGDALALWRTGRICHMHLSEFGGEVREWGKLRPILHPGEAKTDFEGIFAHLRALDYAGTMTIEAPVLTDDGVDIEKMRRTLRYLRGLTQSR